MFARILLAFSFVLGFTACTTTMPTAWSPSDACSESSPTYDSREVQCQLPKAASARKFRFKANFSGGHDDTVARIEPFINNSPMNCDEGSKTHLSAEDGEISLWCDFSVADPAQGSGVFKVMVRWSHAEYVNYEMVAQ